MLTSSVSGAVDRYDTLQLGLDGNFVACGQFEKLSVIRDCLSCSNSFSEEGDLNGDILHCMEQNGKVVDDDFYCNNWN